MRKHPYISATIIATLLAIVVWLVVPKEYTAITKLSDEYKEVDLAIGLDRIQARLNSLHANEGINDMEVYCKMLKTEDFARSISRKQVPGKGMDYGHWVMQNRHFWQTKDTIEAIQDHINYNYSNKHETLTISFTDCDATIAALMLDIVRDYLQNKVTQGRHAVAQTKYRNALNAKKEAFQKYHQAQLEYSSYADSHRDNNLQEEKQREKYLQGELENAYKNYEKATKESTRQHSLMKRSYMSFAVVKTNEVPSKEDGTIWSYIFSFSFISLVFTMWIRKCQSKKYLCKKIDFGNIFSPWSITISMWLFVIICIFMLGDKLYPLTSQFYVCISLWISIFCISSFITYNLFLTDSSVYTSNTDKFHVNKFIFYSLLAVTLILSPLCVKKVMDIVNMFGSDNLMNNIRVLAVEGEGFGLLDTCFIINKVLFIAALWKYPKVSIWTILLIGFLVLLNSFAIMDKGTLFFVVIVIVFVLYERGKIKLYHMILGGIIMVALFFTLTILRGGTDEAGNLRMDDMDILEFLAMYIFANPVAFGYLDQSVNTQVGANTFFLLYYYLNKFGVGNFIVVDIVQEFTYVPIMTNQYTIMQPFYIDFGVGGVAFFALVYGVFLGWCYSSYKSGNSVGKCLYTYLVMVLVLQFGQEQIFLLPVAFIKICVLIYIVAQNKFRVQLT